MSATMRPAKRNSLPSLGLGFNKFFVSKRASMFETQEETPQEKRERSPCGILESSERKMQGTKASLVWPALLVPSSRQLLT